MKIVNNSRVLVRLVAADKLRQRGFEVYAFPVAPVRHLPDLVAYRNERFYNVYLFESVEKRDAEFGERERNCALEYAKPIDAVVATMIIRLVVRKKDGA